MTHATKRVQIGPQALPVLGLRRNTKKCSRPVKKTASRLKALRDKAVRCVTECNARCSVWSWHGRVAPGLSVAVAAHNRAEMGDVPRDGAGILGLHFVTETAQLGLLQFEQFDALRVWCRSAQFIINCFGELGDALADDAAHDLVIDARVKTVFVRFAVHRDRS
ncbi:protein of unknown function [Paraburkholderia kururiensis]